MPKTFDALSWKRAKKRNDFYKKDSNPWSQMKVEQWKPSVSKTLTAQRTTDIQAATMATTDDQTLQTILYETMANNDKMTNQWASAYIH